MAKAGGILRFLTCGSVDDGKSTLIGHLLHLTGNLYDDQVAILEQESARLGTAGEVMDYSLLLDGLTAEREQGITIDVAYRYFATPQRHFIVADTPGHERYTRNMATAASRCSAALILVDARQGVLPQTRRHALICALMGIRQLLFVVNKMDMAGWSEQGFREVQAQCNRLAGDLERFGLPRAECVAVPVSALNGDNLVALSPNMPWYDGTTVMGWLHAVAPGEGMEHAAPRLPVQYVIRWPAREVHGRRARTGRSAGAETGPSAPTPAPWCRAASNAATGWRSCRPACGRAYGRCGAATAWCGRPWPAWRWRSASRVSMTSSGGI